MTETRDGQSIFSVRSRRGRVRSATARARWAFWWSIAAAGKWIVPVAVLCIRLPFIGLLARQVNRILQEAAPLHLHRAYNDSYGWLHAGMDDSGYSRVRMRDHLVTVRHGDLTRFVSETSCPWPNTREPWSIDATGSDRLVVIRGERESVLKFVEVREE